MYVFTVYVSFNMINYLENFACKDRCASLKRMHKIERWIERGAWQGEGGVGKR